VLVADHERKHLVRGLSRWVPGTSPIPDLAVKNIKKMSFLEERDKIDEIEGRFIPPDEG
jgi:hypothetical protein